MEPLLQRAGLRHRHALPRGEPEGGLGCFGATKEMKACQVAPPEAVDCVWGSWSHWSGCSCSCGGGTKRRSRAIEKLGSTWHSL